MTVTQRVCIVGLEESEVAEFQSLLEFGIGVVAHQALPSIILKDGQLFVESGKRVGMIEVTKVVFHGIYEKDVWQSDDPCLIEDFLPGDAVRVVLIGDKHWQIKLEGETWLKSIHDLRADFMQIDPELLEDTKNIAKAFRLELVANHYIIAENGTKHLLEVNHIPNVSRFPEIWAAYRDYATEWVNKSVMKGIN